jgi:hypothetical protein
VNQSITFSYIPLTIPQIERQNKLKKYYSIDCKCIRCETNSDKSIDYSRFEFLRNHVFDKQNPTLEECVQELKLSEELFEINFKINLL